MKYLIIMSLFFTGCANLNINYKKKCHLEGNTEVCEVEETPYTHPGRDVR